MNRLLKIKRFLVDPLNAFDQEREQPLTDAFKYFLALSLFNGIFDIIIFRIGLGLSLLHWATIPLALINSLYFLLYNCATGLILSGLTYPLKGKKGCKRSLKAVFYGSTPRVFDSLPFLGPIMILWGTVLITIGLKELHKVSFSIWLFLSICVLIQVLTSISLQIFLPLAKPYLRIY